MSAPQQPGYNAPVQGKSRVTVGLGSCLLRLPDCLPGHVLHGQVDLREGRQRCSHRLIGAQALELTQSLEVWGLACCQVPHLFVAMCPCRGVWCCVPAPRYSGDVAVLRLGSSDGCNGSW